MKTCCNVRLVLAEAFSTAARLYAESVVLFVASGNPEGDYIHLRKLSKEAHSRAEAACADYEEHVDLHRCFDAPSLARNDEHTGGATRPSGS